MYDDFLDCSRILWSCGLSYKSDCGYIIGRITNIGVVLLVGVWPCGWSNKLTLVMGHGVERINIVLVVYWSHALAMCWLDSLWL